MERDTVAIILARLDYQDRQFSDARKETREALHEIVVQAKETNGRVKAMELWKARVEGVGFVVNKFGLVISATVGAAVSVAVTKFLG